MKNPLTIYGILFIAVLAMAQVSYSACEGDMNCDGSVDGADLAILAADFGTMGCAGCSAETTTIVDSIASDPFSLDPCLAALSPCPLATLLHAVEGRVFLV